MYRGPIHSPRLSDLPLRHDIGARSGDLPRPVTHHSFSMFRTAIHEEMTTVNFAGDAVIATWGCGTQCRNSVIVNAKTGAVYGYIDSDLSIDFKADSRLVIINQYQADEADMEDVPPTTYWLWDGAKLKRLRP